MNNRFDQDEQIETHNFEWFLPSPPKPVLILTVFNDGVIRLNGKLCEEIPKTLKIGVDVDGKTLGLVECSEKGYRIPKNGRVKDINLVKAIEKRGVSLPAKYMVEKVNDLWVARIVPPIPITKVGSTPKKPRRNGLKTMLPKRDF